MTVKQQWTLVIGFVILISGALLGATWIMGDELFPVAVGSRAPDFRASTLDVPAHPKSLADYRGQVVLLNIWATWCGPCRIEMPSIEEVHRALGPRGLHVVAVSVDDPGQEPQIRSFARDLGLPVEIRPITHQDVTMGDELFFSGTAVEVMPIREVDGTMIGDGTPGPITRQIQQTFYDAVHGRLPQYRSWLSPVGAD